MVIGGRFGVGDHFDGGDHFGGGTRVRVLLSRSQTDNLPITSSDALRAGAPNENIVQNHLNIALLNVF